MSGTTDAPMDVAAAIRDAIEASGPITFAEYMELSLYGPGGYYETPPVGPRGDFVTSPHVHAVFGELLARALRELWDLLDEPHPFRVVEVGAGDGTLARSLMAARGDLPLEYAAVERSPGARAELARIEEIQVREGLSGGADVVLANELLDNLPFRVLRDVREVRVGWDEGRAIEVLAPADAELMGFAESDAERIVPIGALDFVDAIAGWIERGYVVLIDYGGLGTAGGPLHGYRGHEIVEDVLARPGGTDITAGVDFELIATRAEADGLVAFPTVSQRDALVALGFEDWFRSQLEEQHAGLDDGRGLEAVRVWSGKSRATLLVDPGGLGRLRWLVLATPGLEPPGWLTRAIDRSSAREPGD